MAAFSVLPDFGFLTLAKTERRRARRERNGPSTGPPGQQAKSASFRRNPRISVGPRNEKGKPRVVDLIYLVEGERNRK